MSITAYSTNNLNRPAGEPDPSGPCDCHGIPAGGAANQVLKKNSATDYDATWQNEAAGTFNQNNITRVRYITAATNTQAAFATAINNLPTFVIGETEIFKFQAGVPNEEDPMQTDIYILELMNIGKGTYGLAGTQLSHQHIWISGIRRFAPDYAENLPTTQTINLGDVGANDIVTAFNGHTFIGSQNPVQNQSEGYVLVLAVMNGNPSKYLFTGEGGNYGVGGNKTAIPEDFGFFSEAVDADYLPTGGFGGNAQQIVDSIPSDTFTTTADGLTPKSGPASSNKVLHGDGTWKAAASNPNFTTGDVRGTTELTIQPKAVTNAKLADVPTKTIKGRTASGSGVPKDLSIAEVKAMLGLEDFTTQEITSGGNYNNLEVTANLLVFTNTNAQAVLNGVWGKKDFHILNLSPTYDVKVNHDSSSVADPLRRIKLPTNAGSVGVKGTARVLFTESYGYFISDTWGSLYRPEFKGLTETRLITVNENSNADSIGMTEFMVFRDAQTTPMTKAILNSTFPDATRPFQVVCKQINTIYMLIDDNAKDWAIINTTTAS